MAEINVKRFVDIDIVNHVASSLNGTRDTMLLFTTEGVAGTTNVIESLSQANTTYAVGSFPTTNAYLQLFFLNGGIKCKVVEGAVLSNFGTDLMAVDNKYIVVAFADVATNASDVYAKMKEVASARSSNTDIYGVNEKIILARTNSAESVAIKNLAVKYSNVLGAEMTIGAYLTKINVYKTNSVADYAFTTENITAETPSDSTFGTIIEDNMNVDITLSNLVRNCGGNCMNGADITNEFVRIVLHQTLTDRVLNLLLQKLRGQQGLTQLYSTITQELEQYRASGYLTTDKIWTDEALSVRYNNVDYLIIDKGTALINGYFVRILPFSALTAQDKADRKTPPIYIVLADQYSIRQVTINGEII